MFLSATHIINRLPAKILDWKCQFEVLTRKLSDYNKLRVFGCLCYCTNIHPHKGKFDARSRKCAFIGYVPNYRGYKVFVLQTHEVLIYRDVKFYESNFAFKDE